MPQEQIAVRRQRVMKPFDELAHDAGAKIDPDVLAEDDVLRTGGRHGRLRQITELELHALLDFVAERECFFVAHKMFIEQPPFYIAYRARSVDSASRLLERLRIEICADNLDRPIGTGGKRAHLVERD